jgi:hypothetical protein
MGIRKSDKHQLLTQTCTNHTTSWLMHNLRSEFIRLTTAQTWGKPPPSPLYYTLCLSTRSTSKWHFVAGLPNGSPEIPKVGTFATLGAHNFMCKPPIAMRSKAKLLPLLSDFQRYVAHHLHTMKSGRFPTFGGRESIANLTPDPSFGHNLCLSCPNGSCEPTSDIFVPRAFQ